MTRYTVVWLQSALEELADIWLQSPDRNNIAAATHRVDVVLAEDAGSKGADVSEGIRALFSPPIRVLYAVREADRIVEVLGVRRL